MTDLLAPTLAGIRRGGRRRPEWSAVGLVVVAWVTLASVGHGDARSTPMWTVMCVAMMVPTALPAVRHVAVNSLRWRRQRAIAWFLAAYVGVWTAFGAVVVPVLDAAGRFVTPGVLLAAALAVAAAWQMLPYQRAFRRGCHRTVPLPPTGWTAARADLRFGLRHGGACVGLCWPVMLVMALVMHRGLMWMIVFTVATAGNKLLPRGGRFARPAALVLGSLALSALLTSAG